MRTARFQDVFGASLNRIESQREFPPGESEPACDSVPGLVPLAGPVGTQLEVESVLLDVAPATIDEYMDRVLARTQRTIRERDQARDAGDRSAPVSFATELSAADLPLPTDSAAAEETTEAVIVLPSPEGQSTRPAAGVDEQPPGESVAGDTRANRDHLKDFVIQSTRSTLVRQIRRQHWMGIVRQLLLVFIALSIAAVHYTAYFAYGVPVRHLAWGSTAIGIVALLGMVQLWSREARRQAKRNARCFSKRGLAIPAGTRGRAQSPIAGRSSQS